MKMNDTISRQAALAAITARADRCAENFSTNDPFWEGLVIAKSIVKGLPSVQASTFVQPERKTGHWLPDNRSGGGFWVCSCCKFPSEAFAADKLYKFCPNCGADLRGEQE